MKTWFYRILWFYFILSIVINFFHPNVYLINSFRFLEVAYWIMYIFIAFIILSLFYCIKIDKKIIINGNINEIEKAFNKSKTLYSYFYRYVINTFMIFFAMIVLGDKSLTLLFIVGHFEASAINKLLDDAIKLKTLF